MARWRRIVATFLSAVVVSAAVGQLPAAGAAGDFTVRDVGVVPNYAIASYGSHVGTLPGKGPRVWMAIDGQPVTVAQVDPADQQVDWQLPLPGSDGGTWSVTTAADGTVFVGTWPDGVLYRKGASETAFTRIGRPRADTTWIWSLVTDDEGNVYGDSYSTGDGEGRVFSWSQATGFRDYGVAAPGVAYVRAIAQGHGAIYAGTGPAGNVIAIDKETGDKRDLGWPAGVARGFVQDLRVVGAALYMHLGGGVYVYDLARDAWTTVAAPGFGRAVSDTGPRGEVYADAGNTLVAIDPRRGTSRVVATNPLGGYLLSLGWVPVGGRQRLVGTDKYGNVLSYDPAGGAVTTFAPKLVGAPITPHALVTGPDGRVYTGGYMIGGLVSYDPASGQFGDAKSPVPQIEGMGTLNGKLYLGTYSGAVVYEYDPTVAWSTGTNPKVVLNLGSQDQDRPFAVAPVGDTLAVGTVPDYGVLGGVLALYDPATGQSRTWRNVVTDQSVVSLTSAGGVLYGGTSVYGGLGVAPTQTDGKVFAFDPVTGTKLWEVTPVPGQRAVTGLSVGPDGDLWGMAGGQVFRMDPTSRTVTTVATIATIDWPKLDHYWADGAVTYNPVTRRFNGAVRGVVFDLDPATGIFATLATGATWFLQHGSGTLYWTVGNNLFEAKP